MNTTSSRRTSRILAFAASVALSGCVFAAPASKGEGLDALDDRALGQELSSRGIGNLLDYYFKIKHISESDQQAIKTVGALSELNKPTIPYGEKVRRVRQVGEGIDAVLLTMKDPVQMMNTAGMIVEYGVKSEVNNLEYWGEDAVTQAQLKPLSSAVVKLLDAAAKTAQQQADDMSKNIKGSNDPLADKWEKMDNLAHTAAYTKSMSVYFDAIATSPKDPARKKMSEEAIESLKEFDNPDSGVQPRIRNMIAKLQITAGNFAEAKKNFTSVSAEKTDVKPAPNPFEQYDARYFTVVTDLLAKDLAAARTDKVALDEWQAGPFKQALVAMKLPANAIADNDKAIAATGQLLQWRVHVLEGDLAKEKKDAAAQAKADQAAEAVLVALRTMRPDLAPRIDQQLVNRMGNKPIDDKTPPSILLALLKKAMNESFKAEPDKPDPAVLDKGIEAARAVINRKDRTGLLEANVTEAMLSIAIIQDKGGKKVEAVNSYLDFATTQYTKDPRKATEALDRAGYLVMAELKKLPVAPPGYTEAYNRFLPIAINPPFNHKELAYLYAEQQRGLKNYTVALQYFRMVPKDNALVYKMSLYRQMLTLDAMLDTKQDPAAHKQTVDELSKACGEVKAAFSDSTEKADRSKAVQATLMQADLARIEFKDAAKTLQILEGFENLVKGLPAEEDLMRGCMNARVNAYMATGKTNEAVQILTKLLEGAAGDQGIAQVRALLDQLDKEFVKADLIHDLPTMRTVAKNESMLTHYLVTWSDPATQKNPAISQYYYRYAVYDARTQRIAGSLAEDPAEKKKLLSEAAQRYLDLQSKSKHDLYLQIPEVKKRVDAKELDRDDPDPAVATGAALSEFELGNYQRARDLLDVLIANKKLGTPQVEKEDPITHAVTIVDNDLYWEGTYKFLKSAHEVSKNDPKAEEIVVRNLKNILIRGGIPERWQDEFESLTKEVAPGFVVPSAQTPATAPAAPVKPVAAK